MRKFRFCLTMAAVVLAAAFPAAAQWTNGQAAAFVIGQANFTSNGPSTTSNTLRYPGGVAMTP